jgi:EAL domain-containing protein (putative c-di-GMP-specific phosphodiesterase class I)
MVKMSSSMNAFSGPGLGAELSHFKGVVHPLPAPVQASDAKLDCQFQPVLPAESKQPLGYRAVTAFCDSHARAVPFSELMGWAKSPELQAILQSYRLQEVLVQAGARLNGARLILPVEAKLFYANRWSWLEVVERAENAGILCGQLIWELLESEAASEEMLVRRFVNEGREFFARFVLTLGGVRSPDWQQLQMLRPDFLQLPAQIVNGCVESKYRRDWIAATIRQAGELGIKTLACGVHAKSDWEWLLTVGIAGGSGGWLGAAGPLPERKVPMI